MTDLEIALEALQALHAAVWTHFDPGMDQGDKKQPKEIKEALTAARQAARQFRYRFDGWER